MVPVAADVRSAPEQRGAFAVWAERMRCRKDETSEVIEALQLLERTHGAGVVVAGLPFLALVLDVAEQLTGHSIGTLAAQRGYRSAGLLVGALVEDRVQPASRHFPASTFVGRAGSPNFEFEDVLAGVALLEERCRAESVPELFHDVRRAAAYVSIAWAFRSAAQQAALSRVSEFAGTAQDEVAFIQQVNDLARDSGIALPARWRHYAWQAARRRAPRSI